MIKKFLDKRIEARCRALAIEEPVDERDYSAEEVFSFAAIEWKEKQPSEWRKFPIFHQDGSSSCVGQTVAKVLGIENYLEEGKFVHFSARDIYCRGFIDNGGGMFYREGVKIGYEHGATIEQLMPSQMMNEAQMRVNDSTTLTDQIALVGKGGNYFDIQIDFDRIANIVNTGKAVALGTRFNSGGFSSPEVKLLRNGTYGHAVAVVDYCLWKGRKALIFDNSWGVDWGKYGGQGIITEDQINGIVTAWYYEELRNNWRDEEEKPEKPKHQFLVDLKFGSNSNDTVVLQNILKYEQLFPVNVGSTGFYGTITSKAVLAFQKKYKVDNDTELDQLQGRIVGPKTRQKLNEIYG